MMSLVGEKPVRVAQLGEELTIKLFADGGVLLKQDDDLVYILPEDVQRVCGILTLATVQVAHE